MPDPYLEAMMKGELLFQKQKPREGMVLLSKDKFEIAIEEQIDHYVDSLNLEEDPSNKLLSKTQRKAKIRQETLAEIKNPEQDTHIITSLQFLMTHGADYLDQELNNSMQAQFREINDRLEKIDLNKETLPNNLQAFFGLEDSVMGSILKIGAQKFEDGEYSICLSIFTLLSVLNPDNFEYWYRQGIAAQKCDHYELAEAAYNKALTLNPDLFGARLFLIECYIHQERLDEAKFNLAEAKTITKDLELEEIWSSLLQKLEQSLA